MQKCPGVTSINPGPQRCSPFWPFWTQQKSFRAHAAQKGTAGKLPSDGEQNRAVSIVSKAGNDQTRPLIMVAWRVYLIGALDYGSNVQEGVKKRK